VTPPELLGFLSGPTNTLFFILVFLHAIAALAGFGSVFFAGIYASRAAQFPFGPGALARAQPEPATVAVGEGAPADAALEESPMVAGEASSEPSPEPSGGGVDGGLDEGEGEGEVAAASPPAPVERPSSPQEELDAEAEELMRYLEHPVRFWPALLLVPILGGLALWAEPHTAGLDQVWTLGGLVIWIIAVMIVLGIVLPALNQVRLMLMDLRTQPWGTRAAETAWRARLARAGMMASRGATFCDVLFFAAVALMIFRP